MSYSLLELDYSVELDNNVTADTCFAYLLRIVYYTIESSISAVYVSFIRWNFIHIVYFPLVQTLKMPISLK
jgi:hypothetical protein